MFRREKPQKGRYRQFHQMSVEALGFAEPEIDAELIALSARLWRELGLDEREARAQHDRHRRVARRRTSRCSSSTSRAHRELLDEDSLRRLERNPLRILDSKNPELRELIDAAPLLSDYLDAESRAHFERVQALLDDVGVALYAESAARARPRLLLAHRVRVAHGPARRAERVCSGGRYDGLVAQLGGRDTPAVGWALGIERIVELMQAEGIERRRGARRMPISSRPAMPSAGSASSSSNGSASGCPALKALDRRRRRRASRPSCAVPTRAARAFALIVGEAELAAGKVSVKPLREDRPQQLVTVEECADLLRQTPRVGIE